MRDKQLYAKILGVEQPWQVDDVDLHPEEKVVEVFIRYSADKARRCGVCGEVSPGYDHRERRWRHLDTCQYQTVLVAEVPRVRCAEHGVV